MKKLVSALLALTLVGSLAACGSQNTPSASASGSAGGENGYKIVLISNQKSGDMGPVDAMFAGAKRAEADFGVTVNTVVNCKETDIFLWKQNFRIKTYLQIISPQSAHILNNQGFYISCFNFFYQRLKARAIEIYTRKSVIGKMANVLKTIPTGIIFEVFLLIGNRITLASKVIIS